MLIRVTLEVAVGDISNNRFVYPWRIGQHGRHIGHHARQQCCRHYEQGFVRERIDYDAHPDHTKARVCLITSCWRSSIPSHRGNLTSRPATSSVLVMPPLTRPTLRPMGDECRGT